MSNDDYLAIDRHLTHLILAPIDPKSKRSMASLKSDINTYNHLSHNIIEPKEIMQIDSIWYGVVEIGREEVQWVRDVGGNRMRNGVFQGKMLNDAIRYILKVLVMLKWSEVKQYLNVKNMIVVRGRLHFMLIPRNSKGSFSLKRS
jgi:hypothetical protein